MVLWRITWLSVGVVRWTTYWTGRQALTEGIIYTWKIHLFLLLGWIIQDMFLFFF